MLRYVVSFREKARTLHLRLARKSETEVCRVQAPGSLQGVIMDL